MQVSIRILKLRFLSHIFKNEICSADSGEDFPFFVVLIRINRV